MDSNSPPVYVRASIPMRQHSRIIDYLHEASLTMTENEALIVHFPAHIVWKLAEKNFEVTVT